MEYRFLSGFHTFFPILIFLNVFGEGKLARSGGCLQDVPISSAVVSECKWDVFLGVSWTDPLLIIDIFGYE